MISMITMVDSGRKKILAALWVLAVAFLMVAVFWPWISETWPEAKSIAQYLSGNQLVTDAIGLTIFAILVFDFVMRRRSLAKNAINPSYKSLETHIEQNIAVLFTPREKQKEAERELSVRRYVYAKRVAANKMSKQESDRQIALMAEIADDYKAEADLLEGVEKLL